MRLIIAYIQPFMAEKVTDALRAVGVHAVSVLPCQCFGHSGEEGVLGFVDRIKIEVVCADADAEGLLATIREHAHTGHHGDGRIFVSDIAEAVDIRTGERGENVV